MIKKCCPSWLLLLLAAAAFTFSATVLTACGDDAEEDQQDPAAENGDPATGDDPKVFAIAMHKDNCPACLQMGPIWESVMGDLPDGVKPVKFDLTDDETRATTQSLAEEHNVMSVFDEHKNASGYILLIHASDNSEVGRLTHEMDAEAMKQSVNEALETVRGG